MSVVQRTHVAAFTLERFPGGASGELPLGAYSRMKHGDLVATHLLADRLAALLLDTVPALADPRQRVSLPVAYLRVLPACGHVAARVADRLRRARGDAPDAWASGDRGVRVLRIAKDAVTTIDYASAGEDARREQLAALRFTLEDSVNGDAVVLVDDVRITGLAEEAGVAAILTTSTPRLLCTAYIAEAGPALRADPSVERRLNHAEIEHPEQMLPAMEAGTFALTIRYLKWLLGSPQAAEVVARVPLPVAREMLAGALGSGFADEPLYAAGLAALCLRVGA